MKIRLLLSLAGLAFGFALPSFAQQTNTPARGATKEINFSGTHYWSGTPKVFQIDPDRLVASGSMTAGMARSMEHQFTLPCFIMKTKGITRWEILWIQLEPETMRSGQIRTQIK